MYDLEEIEENPCCIICGRPLMIGESDICEECIFETSRPWGNEEIETFEEENK